MCLHVKVVGVEEDLRVSSFDVKGNFDVVPCVEFLEVETPLLGESWGEWQADNREGATITNTR